MRRKRERERERERERDEGRMGETLVAFMRRSSFHKYWLFPHRVADSGPAEWGRANIDADTICLRDILSSCLPERPK